MGRGFQMNTEYHISIDEIISEFSKIVLHGYKAREEISLGFWDLGVCCRFKSLLKRQRLTRIKLLGSFL